MKMNSILLVGAVIAATFSLSSWAQAPAGATPKPMGAEKPENFFIQYEVKNLQNEKLGHVTDLGIDLIYGRIVEVLVESDSSLGVGNKIVAVPPLALVADPTEKVYRLNVSTEVFKSAEAIEVTKWEDAGRSERVAAAYRVFGQKPYFLEEGETASTTARRPKVLLGYVERCNKLLDMPVGNYQNEEFGKVWSMTLDIPKGRILNVIILAPGNFKTKSIVPAMALSFNAKRDALLLDDTKPEYADEPRYIFTEAAYGNESYSHQESYKGPRTNVALEQGGSYRDIDRTARIYQGIRAARINGRHVELGTLNGRVTLRGWAYSEDDKRRMGEIAIAASTLELVDNQIVVGRPIASN